MKTLLLFLVIEAGLILQLDCPDLAMGRHHAYSKYKFLQQ